MAYALWRARCIPMLCEHRIGVLLAYCLLVCRNLCGVDFPDLEYLDRALGHRLVNSQWLPTSCGVRAYLLGGLAIGH